jgi:hypothetical protein
MTMSTGPTQGQALAAIADAVAVRNRAEEAVTEAVANARALDVTWREIAEALDAHQPHAVRKYGPLLKSSTAVEVKAPAERRPDRRSREHRTAQ